MFDGRAMAAEVVDTVRTFVSKAFESVNHRLAEFEARIAAIPAGPRGDKGNPGPMGKQGQFGAKGEKGLKGDRGERGEKGLQGLPGCSGEPGPSGGRGDPGLPGPDGRQGEKGDPGEGIVGPQGDRGEAGADGPIGPQGEPGDAGSRGEKGETGADGPIGPQGEPGADGFSGKDGTSGTNGIDGKDGIPGESIKGDRGDDGMSAYDIAKSIGFAGTQQQWLESLAGKSGIDGKDGQHGRDAFQLDVLDAVDETKSYARGTLAKWQGGMIRAFRDTSPVSDGPIELAGWQVILRGLADFRIEPVDERTFEVTYAMTGTATFSKTVKTPTMLYKEVWRPGEYQRGDSVTRDGGIFVALQDTDEVPGTESKHWLLAVKRGRDGKDAPQPAKPAMPVKLQ